MQSVLSTLSGVLIVVGFIPYIYSIVTHKTQPAKATWLIWATLDIITLAGMYAAESVNGLIVGATCGASTVCLLSWKYGIPGWTLIDSLCLTGALGSIAIWQMANNPVAAIALCQLAAVIGSYPTIQSVWYHPERENKIAWSIGEIASLAAIVAIPSFTLQDAAHPINFFLINTAVTVLVFRKSSDEQESDRILASLQEAATHD